MSTSRILLRATTITAAPRTRPFTSAPRASKTATEAVKDSVKKVDRTISNAAVKGIEVGESVTQKTKEAVGGKVGGKKKEEGKGRGKTGTGPGTGVVEEETGLGG